MKRNHTIGILVASVLALLVGIAACKKDKKQDPAPADNPPAKENYASLKDFHDQNAVKKETFTLTAAAGGTFVSAKGTTISIPANAFVTSTNGTVTGAVTIEFKDIYKKSDMLLSDVPTIDNFGMPLKSAGEFFINALNNNTAVNVRAGKPIVIMQPLNGLPLDTAMKPFVLGQNVNQNPQWVANNSGANPFFTTGVSSTPSSYVFSLYGNLTSTLTAGTWCNSDNSHYFAAYPQSTLTLHPSDDISTYQVDAFLIFKSPVNCMIHVYRNGNGNFPYNYAPVGQQCTAVVVAVKDGEVYSSFAPVTISTQTVSFSLSKTTTDDFKAAVNALN